MSLPAPYLPLLRLAELLRDAKVECGNAELQMLGGLIVLIWLVRSQFDDIEFIETLWLYNMEVWSWIFIKGSYIIKLML
jgi:hypothetical protein